jgi:hypothetical protein
MNLPDPTLATPSAISSQCRHACAVDVVDRLLQASASVRGEEVDALLDFRSLLRRRSDAEQVIAQFCTLRRMMEDRHYLSFYRLRRWLENHLEVRVTVRRNDPERLGRLRLDHYCVEAIRFQCLHSVLRQGEPLLGPKIRFVFRFPSEAAQADCPSVCEAPHEPA